MFGAPYGGVKSVSLRWGQLDTSRDVIRGRNKVDNLSSRWRKYMVRAIKPFSVLSG